MAKDGPSDWSICREVVSLHGSAVGGAPRNLLFSIVSSRARAEVTVGSRAAPQELNSHSAWGASTLHQLPLSYLYNLTRQLKAIRSEHSIGFQFWLGDFFLLENQLHASQTHDNNRPVSGDLNMTQPFITEAHNFFVDWMQLIQVHCAYSNEKKGIRKLLHTLERIRAVIGFLQN